MNTSLVVRRLLVSVLSVVMLAALAAPVGAVGVGNEGCTPGYWKNHVDAWEEFSPDDPLNRDATLGRHEGFTFPDELADFRDDTFLEALNYGGGPGAEGATMILMRAAVASFLNAAHDGLGYPLRRGEIRAAVNDALESLDRGTILAVARDLDELNNLGCPL